MKNVTFKISYSVDAAKKSGFSINVYCGDADELPIPIYMAILKAMLQVEEILNGKAEPPVESPAQPTESNIEALRRMGEAWSQMGKDLLREEMEDNPSTPPHTENSSQKQKRMRKLYTEEEKAEIAQLYRDGVPVAEIAERFGRKASSIYKLASYMNIDRGENPEPPAAPVEPTEKKGSVLKKPWYLQNQKPNNSKKIIHE